MQVASRRSLAWSQEDHVLCNQLNLLEALHEHNSIEASASPLAGKEGVGKEGGGGGHGGEHTHEATLWVLTPLSLDLISATLDGCISFPYYF